MSDKWVATDSFEWDNKQYQKGDQITPAELQPNMELDEKLTALYRVPTFRYTKEYRTIIVNGKRVPDIDTRYLKLPVKKV